MARKKRTNAYSFAFIFFFQNDVNLVSFHFVWFLILGFGLNLNAKETYFNPLSRYGEKICWQTLYSCFIERRSELGSTHFLRKAPCCPTFIFVFLFICLSGITLHLNGFFFQMLHVVYRRALHAVPFGPLCFASMKLSSAAVEISALRVKRDHCHRHLHINDHRP